MEIIIKSDYAQMCEEAAKAVLEAWKQKNGLVVCLPTGNTPLGVYQRLANFYQKGEIDFSRVIAFSLDEYLGLNQDHPQSFAYYLESHLFRHVNIKKENIFRLSGTPEDIDEHCRQYEETIQKFGGIDLQLLGIGKNGHIGFNEPSSSLASRTRAKTLTRETVEANSRLFGNKQNVPRFCLTMGIGTIMESKTIILLASGKDKSEAIQLSIEGPVTASVPASVLQLHPQAKFIMDEEAASLLKRKDYYRWVYENKENANILLATRKK